MAQLPIERIRAAFDAALAAGNVVVEAPTGSGKSTCLPRWCAARGRVLVVEPRRLAARSLARHVAELAATPVGEGVGYVVRFDACHGPGSRIVFVTPGVALRWLADDGLAGFATVVLDEFHERRADTDLLAALLRHHGRHRLVVTSATVEGTRLARYLDAGRLEAEGRLFPVEVRYAEQRDLPRTRDLAQRVAQAVRTALAETDAGDILVFLPGRGEIRAAEAAVQDLGAEVLPLHAGVDIATQDKALRLADHRRVILATNVAETSLTLPGVRVVVDSGLERRTHHRGGRTVLGLHAISQAAAEQRRGRAGRLAPGLCIRLWGREARLEAFTPPEVAREELDDLLLAAAAAGVPAAELVFPDPLPDHAVERARARLEAMGAIDGSGHLTEHGARLFPLPLDPLFAHLITAMPDAATRAAMADLAAALTVARPLLAPLTREGQHQAQREWDAEGPARACDATRLIRLVRSDPPAPIPVQVQAVAEARRIADQTRAALDLPERRADDPVPRQALLAAALEAAPELAFVRRAKRRHALGNGETEVEVARESHFPEDAEAALVFDQHSVPAQGTTRTLNLATCMAPVPLKALAAAGLGTVEHTEPTWTGETVVTQARRVYAGRTIGEEEVEPEGEAAREAVADLVLRGSLVKPAGRRLREDVAAWNLYLELGEGEGAPVEARNWLLERLTALGVERGSDVALLEPDDLAFEGIPAWERARFDERYPRHIRLSNLELDVEYDARRRQVTVVHRSGKRRDAPKRMELPAWPGWSVRYRNASRVVPVK